MPDLIQIDQHLFSAINQGLSNNFFDWLMPLIRNRFFWSPVYLFLAIFFVRNYGKRGWMLLIFFALTFGVTDYLVVLDLRDVEPRMLANLAAPGLWQSIG